MPRDIQPPLSAARSQGASAATPSSRSAYAAETSADCWSGAERVNGVESVTEEATTGERDGGADCAFFFGIPYP